MKKITLLLSFFAIILINHSSFSQIGTINFSTTDDTNLGVTADDGEGGSTDISDVIFNIFISDASGVATGGNIFFDQSGGGYEGLSATGDPGSTGFVGLVLKTADGSEFDFNGFSAAEYGFVGITFKVEGFKNTVSTGSTTVVLSAFGISTYASGDFLDANFGDVDEIRITNNAGGNVIVAMDAFVITPSTSTLGLDEFIKTGATLKLFPNPSIDYIQVSGLNKKVNYIIYNLLGTKIKEDVISNNEKINIIDFNSGFYFLKLNNRNTIKFIKK